VKNVTRILRTALGIGALTIGLGVAASAQEPAPQNPTPEDRPNQNQNQRPGLDAIFRGFYESKLLIRALNLTPDQMGRIRVMQREFGPTLVAAQRAVRQRRIALEDAIFNPNSDEAAIEQLAKELAQAEGRALMIRTKMQFQIRQILTPEQLKTFNDLRNENRPEPPNRANPGRPANQPPVQ
jgi:Spy/CpxP family protein refolding chaperone